MRSFHLGSIALSFVLIFLVFSQAFAVTESSLEYVVSEPTWLNEGKPILFDGIRNGKNATGKLYTDKDTGKASLRIDFYKGGKLVFTKIKEITFNIEKEPFFHYNFSLDHLPKGEYQVKVSATPETWGWLNY